MNLIEEFEQISKPIQFNREEYFYHAFSKLSEDNIKSYLTEGIKSPLLLKNMKVVIMDISMFHLVKFLKTYLILPFIVFYINFLCLLLIQI